MYPCTLVRVYMDQHWGTVHWKETCTPLTSIIIMIHTYFAFDQIIDPSEYPIRFFQVLHSKSPFVSHFWWLTSSCFTMCHHENPMVKTWHRWVPRLPPIQRKHLECDETFQGTSVGLGYHGCFHKLAIFYRGKTWKNPSQMLLMYGICLRNT